MPTKRKKYALPRKVKCGNCPLLAADKNYSVGVPTFGYGNDPKLFFITEALGREEDLHAEPMVGSAGDILRAILKLVGIKKYYIGHVVNCRPYNDEDQNREPTSEEIACCRHHVIADVLHARPEIVVFLGGTSTSSLLSKNGSVSSLRGWHTWKISTDFSVQAYVTNHPSAVYYDGDKKAVLENDLIQIKRKLAGQDLVDLNMKYRYVDTILKLKKACKTVASWTGEVVFDWETTGTNVKTDRPLTLSIGQGDRHQQKCYSIPFDHKQSPWRASLVQYNTMKKLVAKLFRVLLKRNVQKKILLQAQNAKFEVGVVDNVLGVVLHNIYCTMQGAHAVDENRLARGRGKGIYSLEALNDDWLMIEDHWDQDTCDLLYSGRGAQANLKKIAKHGAIDVAVQACLHHEIEQRAADKNYNLDQLRPLLCGIPYVLSRVECNGIPIDNTWLTSLLKSDSPLVQRQAQIIEELENQKNVQRALRLVKGRGFNMTPLCVQGGKLSGFNINQRKYLQALFLDVLELDWGNVKDEQTPTGLPLLNKKFFEHFEDSVPECEQIVEWKKLEKLRTTYLENWFRRTSNSPDGRLYTSFNGVGTKTGRLSGDMQQIPRGDKKVKVSKVIKKLIKPDNYDRDTPNIIVAADYSQAELRWLGEISGEQKIIKLYQKRADLWNKYKYKPNKKLLERIDFECDIHRSTASITGGIPIDQVDSDARNRNKRVNFGIVYGITEYGLSAQLGITIQEARKLIDDWLKGYDRVNMWFHEIEQEAVSTGCVYSPIGRRRVVDFLLLGLTDSKTHKHLLNVARNAPIQSVASDMTLWTAIKLQRYIDRKQLPWKILAFVHDSIIAEVPLDQALHYMRVLWKIAEDPAIFSKFGVPKIVCPQEMNIEIGWNYGETVELTTNHAEQEKEVDKLQHQWKHDRQNVLTGGLQNVHVNASSA